MSEAIKPAGVDTEPPGDLSATTAPTTAEVLAYVGSNAAYYLRRWAGALAGRPGGTGFNWAAFLFAPLWLPYRRLYAHALALYAPFQVIGLVLVLAETSRMASYDTLMMLVLAQYGVMFVASVVIGACGNRWVLARFEQALAETRARHPGGDNLRALANRGGTDIAALFFFPIASAVLGIVVEIAVTGAPGR